MKHEWCHGMSGVTERKHENVTDIHTLCLEWKWIITLYSIGFTG
jgi:hypothetical protein